LELSANRWSEARRSLEAAADFARTAGLIDPWARASLNLGVLAFRLGNMEEASRMLGEALRLGAEVQQTELQLIATYNLGHLARELGDHRRAGDTYELAMELAERIGQSEAQIGALAGMALSRLALGDLKAARELYERLLPLIERQERWFKAREFVESLRVQLAIRNGDPRAYELFESALALAEESDVYGAIWLIAEVGPLLGSLRPDAFQTVVARFSDRPEVQDSPPLRARFGVLKLHTAKSVDRM
jgi:tetratricopeptide (TPR) repeat protein